ncbi:MULTISPECIES: Na+/H+ antiporter [Chitinophagaceae]
MHHHVLIVIILLLAVMLLVMLAQKLKIAFPIFLVLAGLMISFIPGVPSLHIEPDVIFLIFLPPLLYEAAWYTSWQDFWKWRRSIGLLAFGLVFFTSAIVAYIAHSMIPGCTLALGFLLGGIVSPPDAVAAATVMKGLSVPKRIMTVLEGESLINDASSLIVYRFALLTVLSGAFSWHQAVGSFFLVAGMGIVVGVGIGFLMGLVHRYLPTTSAIDAALTFLTPYLTYLIAEQLGFSGVMATVTAGLFVSYHAPRIFRSGDTRVNMLGVWTTLIFVLNAFVFVLIGLRLPEIVHGLGLYRVGEGIQYGLLISAVIIVVRFVWVYPAVFIPRWLSSRVRKEPSPGWKGPLVVSWAGMRGVVSLATALSIPLMSGKEGFPLRDLIIFITFVVIFVTLVFQGLTLPYIVRLIKLKEIDREKAEEEQLAQLRLHLDNMALAKLNKDYEQEQQHNGYITIFRHDIVNSININRRKLDSIERKIVSEDDIESYSSILLDIYETQRQELYRLRRERSYSDEVIRRVEWELDMDEAKLEH